MRGLTRLQVLALGEAHVKDADCDELAKLTRLTALELAGNSVRDKGVQQLSSLTRLALLDLSLTEVTAPPMVPSLTELRMEHCPVRRRACPHPHLPPWSFAACMQCGPAVAACRCAQFLAVGVAMQVGPPLAHTIAGACHFRHLVALHLPGVGFVDEEAAQLLHAAVGASGRQLTALNLRGTDVDRLDFLERCQALRLLDLGGRAPPACSHADAQINPVLLRRCASLCLTTRMCSRGIRDKSACSRAPALERAEHPGGPQPVPHWRRHQHCAGTGGSAPSAEPQPGADAHPKRQSAIHSAASRAAIRSCAQLQ